MTAPAVTAEQVARRHRAEQVAAATRVAGAVSAAWSTLPPANLAGGWASGVGPRIVALVLGGQLLAAGRADGYVRRVLAAQGVDAGSEWQVVPAAFAGVASDGRALEPLLFQPVADAIAAVREGVSVERALLAGRVQMDMIVRTQVADAGRVADQAATVARPHVSGYVRLLTPPSCSRCVILAGRWYAWNQGFERHPRCDCIHIPAAEDVEGDLRTDPKLYFDSLSEAEQDRAFTKAGAQAIRDGADIASVVNARRGMYTAGGRLFTTEGTTRRGRARFRPVRLMPEQIYREAGDDRAEAIRLLRLHGYIR